MLTDVATLRSTIADASDEVVARACHWLALRAPTQASIDATNSSVSLDTTAHANEQRGRLRSLLAGPAARRRDHGDQFLSQSTI